MQPPRPRPDLPDFSNPPLNEVVIGVQFAPAKNYQQIRAGEVWSLYKDRFPLVEEHQPLVPQFETFGVPRSGTINLGLSVGAQHDRFWFLTQEKSELIQFQQDRLLHNWRKVGDKTNSYPRYENMIASFERELHQLEDYFSSLGQPKLICNQAEISYINHIHAGPAAEAKASDWFRFLNFDHREPSDIGASYRIAVFNAGGTPIGRINCEIGTSVEGDERIFLFSLTFRGAPASPSIDDVLTFLHSGRELIINEFAERTSDSAHKLWGRIA